MPVTSATWVSLLPPISRRCISAIVGQAPFARSLTPLPTNRASVVFPIASDVDEPAWGKELDLVPTLDIDSGEYDVAVSRLSGSILLSKESVDDTDYPLDTSVEQVIKDKFSFKLDRDFISGTGPFPSPTGILAVAGEVAGEDLELAAIKAKAEIGTAGGAATSIALNPNTIGELESARDDIGRALYPDAGTRFAGLETITAVSASQPVVYDATRLWLVISREFTTDFSDQVSEAWNKYATSMRIVGRFALAAPLPVQSVRKLAVSGGPARAASKAK